MTPGEPSTLCAGQVWCVCACVGRGGTLPPEGGIYLSLPSTSHPSPLGSSASLSIILRPAFAMCTTLNSCLPSSCRLFRGALLTVSQYPPSRPRASLSCVRCDMCSVVFSLPSSPNLFPKLPALSMVRPASPPALSPASYCSALPLSFTTRSLHPACALLHIAVANVCLVRLLW